MFLKAAEATLKRLLVIETFVTYGFPNLKNVKELIYKKGRGFLDKDHFPHTSNDLIEKGNNTGRYITKSEMFTFQSPTKKTMKSERFSLSAIDQENNEASALADDLYEKLASNLSLVLAVNSTMPGI